MANPSQNVAPVDAAHVPIAEIPDAFADPTVVVALRRATAATIERLPPELAGAMGVVTITAAAPTEPAVPAHAAWVMEIDPERGFREARARLGGSLAAAPAHRRVARILRHPVRSLRRRSLYRRRAELRERSIADGIRAAIAGAAAGGPVTVLVPDPVDADRIRPLLDGQARLVRTPLDTFHETWLASGRPRIPSARSPQPGAAAYDPAAYWGGLHQRQDLSAVGQSGLPPQINAWLYRSLARSLRRFLRGHGVATPPPAAAFDVGVGTGYWVRFWRSLGVPVVDGCDLVPGAVDAVRAEAEAARLPGTYVVADIGVPGSLPSSRYAAVSCMNVLLHITDDAAFDRALAGIAALVAPGGVLVLAEPMLADAAWERPHDPALHSRARRIDRYRAPLEAAGLVLEDLRAGTVLANNPIEAGSRRAYARYARWWRWVATESKSSPGSARWLGPLVLGLDRIALRTGAAPSTKLALFRRPAVEPPA